MNTFQMTQKHLATSGISPTLALKPYPFNGRILMGCVLVSTTLIGKLVYVSNDAKTFIEYTQFTYDFSTIVLNFLCLLVLILKVDNLFEFINSCDHLVNTKLKYSASRSIFNEANQLEVKFSEIIYFVIVKMTPASIYVPWCIYTFFTYITTDLGNDAFQLPFPMWLPFDWRNPFGFLVAIAMAYIIIGYVLMIAAHALAITIGFYLYVIAMTKCIKGSLFSINRRFQAKSKKPQILMEQLIEFIEFDSHSKQFFNSFAKIFQSLCEFLFIWSLVNVCCAFLMIHDMVEIFYAFNSLFLACELGQRVKLAFDECCDIIDQFQWYSFPVEIHRILPVIVNFAQQPIEIKCFGTTACNNRETFKCVVRTAYSYFTVLRRFNGGLN